MSFPFTTYRLYVFLVVCIFAALSCGGCSLSGSSRTDDMRGTKPSGVTVKKGARGTKAYTVKGKTYYPLLSSHGFREEGTASWYGKDFHGKKTANGERYDMYGMTAAHKVLPFGTKVKVTNKQNGKSIVVRINDRGPFVGTRIIDLTKTGAERIGMLQKGTAQVVLETQGTVKGLKNGDLQGNFYVQVGAFGSKDNAEKLASALRTTQGGARVSPAPDDSLWRVQAGPYATLHKAESAATSLNDEFPGCFIVAK